MDGERPRLQVLPPSVDGRKGADDQAEPQDLMAGERTIQDRRFRQVGDSDVRFAGAGEGGDGDDDLYDGTGNDTIDRGSWLDPVFFSGSITSYIITSPEGGGLLLSDSICPRRLRKEEMHPQSDRIGPALRHDWQMGSEVAQMPHQIERPDNPSV